MKKILFISHETSRTGAPIVLLHFLRWLKVNQTDIQVDVLALNGGSLETEFIKNCNIFYNYTQIVKPTKLKPWQRVLLKLGCLIKPNPKEDLLLELTKNKYDLIYANTVLCLPLAKELLFKTEETKLVGHVHELNGIIKLMLPNFDNYSSLVDYFIVPSQLVKDNLVNNRGISKNKIDVVHECATVTINETILNFKNEDAVFTIGASGTADLRKGFDVFIQLARYLTTNYSRCDFRFVWVGSIKLQEQIVVEEDLKKLGLIEKVAFVGEQENPSDYFKNFDVFVMTSREDPFPLVCIEIGMLAKPIISFDQAIGTNEILKDAGGFIVPYLSIESMAEKIMTYYKNPKLKEEHGLINKKVFSQFTPDLICPKLFSIIKKQLK